MSTPDENPYTVEAAGNNFEIRDGTARCVVTFADKGSADALAVLLNQVYQKGYKDGYRLGKQTGLRR